MMKRFLVTYLVPASVMAAWKNTDPDQRKEAQTKMQAQWKEWMVGVVAPKNTPAPIIDTLNKAINAGLADPKIKQTITDWGEDVFATSPAEFGKFLAAENEKWGKVIRAANIKL